MNPLILFDYIFYRIAYLYANQFDYDEQKEFAGIIFLSLFQLFNILFMLKLMHLPFGGFSNINPLFIYVGIGVMIASINTVRYKWFSTYLKLSTKWENENKDKRRIRSILIVVYILLSSFFL